MTPSVDDLAELTKELVKIDGEILALLDRRARLVSNHAAAISPNDLWSQVFSQTQSLSASPDDALLTSDKQASVMRHIASACLTGVLQKGVAFLGPVDSYSHLATIAYFGDATPMKPVVSIAAVFDAVDRSEVDYGIVPIENSTHGRVVDTLSRLWEGDHHIVGEVLTPIHHALLCHPDTLDVQQIHSKPQAIEQCRRFLTNHYPHVPLVETASTAAAAEEASQTRGVAAIASLAAGRRYQLRVLGERIEDQRDNVTRFAVLGRHMRPASGDDKTTIMFQTDHRPGALADVMQVFKQAKLNLTWIESFPDPRHDNEYFFVVDFAGHASEPSVDAAITSMTKQTRITRVLGSYPAGRI
ncbi:MAG: prephenate dehydratase [Planctomycetota bacterium]